MQCPWKRSSPLLADLAERQEPCWSPAALGKQNAIVHVKNEIQSPYFILRIVFNLPCLNVCCIYRSAVKHQSKNKQFSFGHTSILGETMGYKFDHSYWLPLTHVLLVNRKLSVREVSVTTPLARTPTFQTTHPNHLRLSTLYKTTHSKQRQLFY